MKNRTKNIIGGALIAACLALSCHIAAVSIEGEPMRHLSLAEWEAAIEKLEEYAGDPPVTQDQKTAAYIVHVGRESYRHGFNAGIKGCLDTMDDEFGAQHE